MKPDAMQVSFLRQAFSAVFVSVHISFIVQGKETRKRRSTIV
jgi:hypothetical protein